MSDEVGELCFIAPRLGGSSCLLLAYHAQSRRSVVGDFMVDIKTNSFFKNLCAKTSRYSLS